MDLGAFAQITVRRSKALDLPELHRIPTEAMKIRLRLESAMGRGWRYEPSRKRAA